MRKIIDAHCHIYPDAISRRAVDSVDRFYDGLPDEHWDGTVQTLRASGREAGITGFVVHSVATKSEQVRSINHFIAASMSASEGAFVGLGTLHPMSPELEADFRELRELGLHGVKLHPDIQRFRADDERAMRIYELCEQYDLPVLVHTGDYRYDDSNPSRIVPILRTFPKLRFVGAHFGGWSVWDTAVRVLPDYGNLMVDTSSSLYWLGPGKMKDIILAYGTERVMYGTDYPLWQQKPELEAILKMGFSQEDLDRILWKNAETLYGFAT